jgi:hypothetical protein
VLGGVGVVVLVLVVVLVTALVTPASHDAAPGGGPAGTAVPATVPVTPADPAIVAQVTHVPVAVANEVGVHAPVAVGPPLPVYGRPLLKVDGKPGIFYYGAEYCPFCAVERWALVVALSRFGTWSGLGNMTSSTDDVYPGTPTFTFVHAHYSSPYVALETVEHQGNVVTADGYAVLQRPTAAELRILANFPDDDGYPFVDFGNQTLITAASFSPAVLQGRSRAQIAAALGDANDPATRAIVAAANYLTAATCRADGQQPRPVCTSPGVSAADRAMGLPG